MDIQREFNGLYDLIEKHRQHPQTDELLPEMKNSEVMFHATTLETSKARKIYFDRAYMQRNGIISSNVAGYDELIEHLGEYSGESVHIFNVITTSATFSIFTSGEKDRLIAILKSDKKGMQTINALNNKNKESKIDFATFAKMKLKLT